MGGCVQGYRTFFDMSFRNDIVPDVKDAEVIPVTNIDLILVRLKQMSAFFLEFHTEELERWSALRCVTSIGSKGGYGLGGSRLIGLCSRKRHCGGMDVYMALDRLSKTGPSRHHLVPLVLDP